MVVFEAVFSRVIPAELKMVICILSPEAGWFFCAFERGVGIPSWKCLNCFLTSPWVQWQGVWQRKQGGSAEGSEGSGLIALLYVLWSRKMPLASRSALRVGNRPVEVCSEEYKGSEGRVTLATIFSLKCKWIIPWGKQLCQGCRKV